MPDPSEQAIPNPQPSSTTFTGGVSPEQFKTFLLELLNSKEAVILSIIKDMTDVERQYAGFLSVIPSLDDPTLTEANLRHQLKTSMQVTARQSQILRRLLMFSLITVSTSDFDGQVAQVATKFGAGQEALQAMFRNKMKPH